MPAITKSYLAALRDATVAALNGAPAGTFNVPFTAAATNVPIVNAALGEPDALQVLVSPCASLGAGGETGGNTMRIEARKAIYQDEWIDVGIIQLVANDKDPLIDDIMLLGDLIRLFTITTPSTVTPFAVTRATNEPPYDPIRVTQNSVFLSVVTLHYSAAQMLPGY